MANFMQLLGINFIMHSKLIEPQMVLERYEDKCLSAESLTLDFASKLSRRIQGPLHHHLFGEESEQMTNSI
jgi:hypothetical protein